MIAHLIETGEMEKLKKLLKCRLIESGWRDEMKVECKNIIQGRDVNQITVDQLVKEITPKGREKVNAQVKQELLQSIRTVLKSAK